MSKNEESPQGQSWLELPGGKLHWLGRECRIGRTRVGNDLVIEERLVSGRHLIINCDPDGYTLIDQHSTNGTYLNGLLVQKAETLKDGDEIRLAKIVALRFRCAREQKFEAPRSVDKTTVQTNRPDARECWLLLADVAGFSNLIAKLGNEAALLRLQDWITGMRPLIEGNGGSINSYVGDAIFAYWPRDLRSADQVLATVRALEGYRRRAPASFSRNLFLSLARTPTPGRAGTTTALNSDVNRTNKDNDPALKLIAYYNKSGEIKSPQDVGKLEPNRWGLYDMHGNLEELTKEGASRGGSAASRAEDCRSAVRIIRSKDFASNQTGFRLVLRFKDSK